MWYRLIDWWKMLFDKRTYVEWMSDKWIRVNLYNQGKGHDG